MFTNNVRAFVATWFIVLLVLVIGMAGALGYNSINGSFSPIDGINSLGELFGGLSNVAGMLLLFLVITVAFFGSRHVAKNDLSSKANSVGFVSVIVLVAAAVIGVNWITIDGNFWPIIRTLIAVIVIVTLATLGIFRTIKTLHPTPSA